MRASAQTSFLALAVVLVACSSFHEATGEGPDAGADSSSGGSSTSFSFPSIVPPEGGSSSRREAGVDARAGSQDAATDTPPSCVAKGPGMTACGAAQTGVQSCCASAPVEGGTYDRTFDLPGFDGGVMIGPDGAAYGAEDPATVSSFRLDTYLVTVGRFRPFVNAVFPPDGGVGWSPPVGSGKHTYLNGGLGLRATGGGYEPGWAVGDSSNVAPTDTNLACDIDLTQAATWTQYPGPYEYYPINCVNWYEAYAFCIWDGGFLPSDAELGYAQAGGAQQREFPWGSAPPGIMNLYAIYGTTRANGPAQEPVCYYPDDAFCVDVTGSMAPVGTPPFGVGRWGQTDLAGEMFEWTLDWYDQNGFIDPCTDCAYLTPPGTNSQTADGRVLRGGDFESPLYEIVTSARFYDDPTVRTSVAGFRCARAPAASP